MRPSSVRVISKYDPILVHVEASDFITTLARGEFKPPLPPRHIVVRGTVDLVSHPMGSRVEELPSVTISGDLIASGKSTLKKCHCNVLGNVELDGSMIEEFSPSTNIPPAASDSPKTFNVHGRFSAQSCPRLGKISGIFLGSVLLDKSPVKAIQNDFRCHGDLSVSGCSRLEFLNCSAHRIVADKSSIREFGASTSCEYLSAEGCLLLKKATRIGGLQWAKYNGSAIEEVTPDFRCTGSVFLYNCPSLKKLSGKIHSVEVGRCALDSVVNLNATEVIISNCEKLPTTFSNVSVRAAVFASSSLLCLPEGLPKETNVRIASCKNFCHLPDSWNGDLSLSDLPSLERTPDRFRCEGNLDISECPSMRKMEGYVGGDLWLMSETPSLTELNSALKIGGNLRLAGNSGVKKLGCEIHRDLISNSCQINETSPSFTALGNADFQGCQSLKSLRGFVKGQTMLDDSSIVALGADFECGGDLLLRRTKSLVSLNCSVSGGVWLEDSSIQKIGPAFHCGKKIKIERCSALDRDSMSRLSQGHQPAPAFDGNSPKINSPAPLLPQSFKSSPKKSDSSKVL